MKDNSFINIDDIINIDIKKIGINGEGIGYYNKLAIFVDNALPNENIDVKITNIFENRAIGEVVEIKKESEDRVEPFCPKYHECGGCQLQHLKYEKTLKYKRDILIESLNKYYDKNLKQGLVKKVIKSPNIYNYRNKANLPVQFVRGKNQVGIYKRGTNHFVCLENCPIQMESLNEVLKTITSMMNKYKVDGYNPKTKKGFVKALSVRCNEDETEIQVSFIMFKKSLYINQLSKELVRLDKRIKSVFVSYNEKPKEQSFFTEKIEKIYGEDTINIKMDNKQFKLKPDAFFQLNYLQANKFYNIIKDLSDLKGKETIIDAYAGAATISHYLAHKAKKIYAIELDKASVESGKISLFNNNIDNVNIIQGDFIKALSGLKKMDIDLMVFDPPRTGLEKNTLEKLKQYHINRIVYGSCNQVTLAKDLSDLEDYQVMAILPLDMFPWTSLVEIAVLLKQK
ncbi:23S rRNA (uracil(1939)-C(5))-methyltransferase RlmD [Acholeplasma sp. OttesenSCG-928-E16]|nr:23S rRNA (uracil(1939)-C(5))-methyltransferase RlmD [Acholeplasma sp. OttesenSCG-928-E16]